MKIIIYDLETTGVHPINDKIIQLSAIDYNSGKEFDRYINPNTENKAEHINNISQNLLDNSDVFDTVFDDFLQFSSSNAYLIAHNNHNFDKLFLKFELKKIGKKLPINWKFIDSLKISRTIYPSFEEHNIGFLSNVLKITKKATHNAIDDVRCLLEIFKTFEQSFSFEDLVIFSNCFIQKMMYFGKYKNTNISDIPEEYVRFMKLNKFFDNNPDLVNGFTSYSCFYDPIVKTSDF